MSRRTDRPETAQAWLARLKKIGQATNRLRGECERLAYPFDEAWIRLRAEVALASIATTLSLVPGGIRSLLPQLEHGVLEVRDDVPRSTAESPETWLRRQLGDLRRGGS